MDDTSKRRTHRACAPCRRKKVRCPGERPICSFCKRLGQPCDYRSIEHHPTQEAVNTSLHHRMEGLETKLDHVLQVLSLHQAQVLSTDISTSSPTSRPYQNLLESQQTLQIQQEDDSVLSYPHDQELSKAGQLYMTWCHNQPLSLFREEGFIETLRYRDQELQLAVQMLVFRFPPGQFTLEKQQAAGTLSKSCRNLVTDRIVNGKIKLSTLQALCILSMTGFANGSEMQAGLDLSMAQYFASSLSLGSYLGDPVEYSLCVQSISLLQNLQGSIPDPAKSASTGYSFHSANSPLDLINHQTGIPSLSREPVLGGDDNHGILFYMAQAVKVWHMARAYAAFRVGPDSPPPWSPQSDYSLVTLRNLELDCRFPLKYRFATNNFGDLSPEALHERRKYWGPWLFIQFLHAAIPTLLNHPFLLSLRLKHFRHMMPQTFMYQSFDLISKHTAWIVCYLDLLEKQQFQITDPTIAHCVVIVATIHLQHSFVEDKTLRKKAQHGYDKCMRFLDRVGATWSFIFSMTQKLRKLRDSVFTTPSIHTEHTYPNEPWSIDAQLLWDILVFEKAGQNDASADNSMFDDLLTSEVEHPQDVAECAMVGSAGISGHRTAWKEISAYAPQENDPYKPLTKLTTPGGTAEEANNGRSFEGLGDLNTMDQGNFLLQAEDFGRAVNDWMNFDMTNIL